MGDTEDVWRSPVVNLVVFFWEFSRFWDIWKADGNRKILLIVDVVAKSDGNQPLKWHITEIKIKRLLDAWSFTHDNV